MLTSLILIAMVHYGPVATFPSRLQQDQLGKRRLILTPEDQAASVVFTPDGKEVVSVTRESTLQIFDAAAGRMIRTRYLSDDLIRAVSLSEDGKYVAFCRGLPADPVIIQEVSTGGLRTRTEKTGVDVSALAFSPDARRLAVGSGDGSIIVYELPSGNKIDVCAAKDSHGLIECLAFSGDGKLIAAGNIHDDVFLWNVENRSLLWRAAGAVSPPRRIRAVVFSPCGRACAAGSWSGVVNVFDLQTGRKKNSLDVGTSIDSIAFAPDGKTIAIGSDLEKAVTLWNLDKNLQTTGTEVHSSGIWHLSYSRDGRWLAIGAAEKRGVAVQDAQASKTIWKHKN